MTLKELSKKLEHKTMQEKTLILSLIIDTSELEFMNWWNEYTAKYDDDKPLLFYNDVFTTSLILTSLCLEEAVELLRNSNIDKEDRFLSYNRKYNIIRTSSILSDLVRPQWILEEIESMKEGDDNVN